MPLITAVLASLRYRNPPEIEWSYCHLLELLVGYGDLLWIFLRVAEAL
jgi:hypothetical protein